MRCAVFLMLRSVTRIFGDGSAVILNSWVSDVLPVSARAGGASGESGTASAGLTRAI